MAIASSGTAENVLRMAAALRREESKSSANGATVTVEEIAAVCDLLARTPTADRGALAGIDPKRADIALYQAKHDGRNRTVIVNAEAALEGQTQQDLKAN